MGSGHKNKIIIVNIYTICNILFGLICACVDDNSVPYDSAPFQEWATLRIQTSFDLDTLKRWVVAAARQQAIFVVDRTPRSIRTRGSSRG